MSLHLTPRAFLSGATAREAVNAGMAAPLLGGPNAFALVQVSGETNELKAARSLSPAELAPFTAKRPAYCGLDIAQPALMGVVNVTADSFSDGGRFKDTAAAVAHGIALADAGAAIIDVGGESTRPGADPVPESQEIARVVPVITALAQRGLRVSVDTRHTGVMEAALAAGARIINDVNALWGPGAIHAAARAEAHVIVMHMQGTPATMQENPTYAWAPGDILEFLSHRIAACVAAGIPLARVAVDPGLGFGKTSDHNAQIIDHIAMYHGLGCAVAIGGSRKRFIAQASRGEAANERLGGSLAVALHAARQGVQIIRVHDVAVTRQALDVARRIGR